MRILVDTNVFLDVLLARDPHLNKSQQVLDWCDANPGSGWIAWHTLSNLYFIGQKLVGKKSSLRQIGRILEVFDVAPVDSTSARTARGYAMADFEDALQAVCAVTAKADYIVTRNARDYRNAPMSAVSPTEFIRRLNA